MYLHQAAVNFIDEYKAAKDSVDFVNDFAQQQSIDIVSHQLIGNNFMSNTVKQEIEFNKQYDASSEYIYLNPMIFMHIEKNMFTESERHLPIEFSYHIVIQLP
jgi:hypothetical protein